MPSFYFYFPAIHIWLLDYTDFKYILQLYDMLGVRLSEWANEIGSNPCLHLGPFLVIILGVSGLNYEYFF
jgi:hypothetical protein